MIKRISLLVLAVIMAFSSVVCVPFFANAEGTTADSAEVKLLKGIGILDDELVMHQPVTRGVYATYTARLYGDVAPSNAAATYYIDVKETDVYCNAISTLTTAGLLNGCGDGTFRPERPITITEAAKVIVDMLGYKYKANVMGGYPLGYNTVAQDLGLFDGVDTNQAYMYGEDFALLLYNALDVDVLLQNGIISDDGTNYVDYEYVQDRTILTENLNMYLEEGVIEANSVTNLTGATLSKNQIVIDGNAYTVKNAQYWQMVGCYVEYVYYQADNSKERVLMYAAPAKNSVLTLSSEEFLSINGLRIEYTGDNGKIKKAELSGEVDFVYNGKAGAFNQTHFDNFKVGSIKLIDNTGNGKYDVVMVENYTSFVVEGVNASQMRVDDGIDQQNLISFDPANYSVVHILNEDGTEASFDSITKNTVISYYINNGYLKAYISKNIGEGVIETIGTVNGVKEYKVNGKLYREPVGYSGDDADVGDGVTVYLDAFGYIADIKLGFSDNLSTGFMLKGAKIQEVMSVSYGFNIYTPQDKTITVYAADKIEYNGTSTKVEDMPDSLPQSIICYRLNDEGKLVALETPVGRDGYVDGRLMTIYPKTASTPYYSRMFKSQYVFDDTTTMFSVPDVEGEITESMIGAITYSDMKDRDPYTVEAYTISAGSPRLKAVLIYGDVTSGIPNGENLATLISLNHILDENEMEVYEAQVMVEGVEKKFVLADEIDGVSSPAVFKPGDCFRYATNADGHIHMVNMIYTVKDGWLADEPEYYPVEGNSEVVLAHGKVIENDGAFLRLSFDDSPYTGFVQDYYALPMSHYSAVTVLTIGARGCTVTKGSIRDTAIGDYVINYRNLMAAVGFVVIKYE